MGGGSSTSTSSSQSTNPQVTSTLNSLLGGVQNAYNAGSTYQFPGNVTQQSWISSLVNANNGDYANNVNSALNANSSLLNNGGLTSSQQGALNTTNNITSQLMNLAGQDQSDAAYNALRNQLQSNIMGDVGSSFTNSGRFGGGSYVNAAENNLASALGSLDYQHLQDQQNNTRSDLASALSSAQQAANIGAQGVGNINSGVGNLSSLYTALQAPSATQSLVGSAQDTANQAAADKNITLLSQLSSILNGTAGAAGSTTTTTTPSTPLWQSLLGLGVAAL